MDEEVGNLLFKVGQFVETKSFIAGYRGAWFRGKIKRKAKKQGMGFYFEYPDFPDEQPEWTKIYQKDPSNGKMHLMVRPCFPPIYRESSLPDLDTILDVTVVVRETWKVGDLVDWWCSGCYWSGRLSKVLAPGKFKVDLLQPPDGEGESYDASAKDLRPALNWSPVDGWLVPKGSRKGLPCARLIKPEIPSTVREVQEGKKDITATAWKKDITATVREVQEGKKDITATAWKKDITATAWKKDITATVREVQEGKKDITATVREVQEGEKDSIQKNHGASLDETVHAADNTVQTNDKTSLHSSASDRSSPSLKRSEHQPEAGQAQENSISKRMKTDGAFSLNTAVTDTVETAILDLEDLVNQINWIKRILEVGTPLTDPVRPSWQFLEHEAPPKPK